jgi:2-polyprenyl-3-methyl-5-hydroxy-6-metoxy-1,4-benzoquinol methylase
MSEIGQRHGAKQSDGHFRLPIVCGPFALAYYPGDITPYLRAWGEMIATLYPPTPVPHPPVRERVRLVILTATFYRQSVWMILLHSLIEKLDTRFFELVAISLAPSEDDQTAWLKERCARYYGMRPGGWEDLLQREAPDVLFLPDTTMNNVSVGVAARRFAPLQVTTWGHPVSSGLQTVDLYFSGTDLEPPDAASHYIERLVRLPGTGACTSYLKVVSAPLPEALTTHFADNRPVALVPCNAFKLVPADDSLWVRLAQTYPTLKLLFFRQSDFGRMGTAPLERITAALTAAGVDVTQQMFVLEFQPFQVFATLLSRATLYLDVPSFSGYTTAWQGVFAGIPIVTLKGRFLRQRLAAGLLETIGCADTVVENLDAYIAKVGELIEEWQQRPEAYAARRARIQAAAPLACNDVRVVRGFERVLLEELAERGNPTALALLPQHRATYPDYHYEREQGCVVAPPRQDTPDKSAVAEPLATPCLQELPMSSSSESDAVPNQFAPTPVHGLMPPTTPSPPGATSVSNPATPGNATPPVWRLLDQDLHLTTLSHTYAPVGLLQMIPAAPRAVFDLGCFVGATGRWLKGQFPGVRVVGVELLPAAAEKARADYDQVFTGRFEEIDLAPLTGQFDTIIAADVLEHLYHPWQSLERLKTLLAPGGALYVSLPNVRNLRVLEGLALGDWPYAGAGILDITHLRFFTRRSALRMLSETGWQVQDVRANLDPQLKGMIEGRDLNTVRNIQLKNLVLRDLPPGETVEFFTLQWFIRAIPQ